MIIENPNPRGSEPRFTRKRLQEAELASVEMLLLLHTKGDFSLRGGRLELAASKTLAAEKMSGIIRRAIPRRRRGGRLDGRGPVDA